MNGKTFVGLLLVLLVSSMSIVVVWDQWMVMKRAREELFARLTARRMLNPGDDEDEHPMCRTMYVGKTKLERTGKRE